MAISRSATRIAGDVKHAATTQRLIAQASRFVVCLHDGVAETGRGEHVTLAAARAAAYRLGQQALIFAVAPGGAMTPVPDDVPDVFSDAPLVEVA